MKAFTLLGVHLPGSTALTRKWYRDRIEKILTGTGKSPVSGDSNPDDLIFSIQVPVTANGAEDFIFNLPTGSPTGSPAGSPAGSPIGLPVLFEKGLRMIQWQVADPVHCVFPRQFAWEASKQGIWNHLTGPGLFSDQAGKGLGHWIANNPNIVHSFENTDVHGVDLCLEIPEHLQDYGAVAPLPNLPFWKILKDAESILDSLGSMTKKELLCLRADRKTRSVSSLGTDIEYSFKMPQDLPPGILDEICLMVDAGGSVDITHVRSNLEKAYLVGYAMENGVIVGNSSLKHPRQVFIDRIHGITGLDFTNFVERGYTSVRPEYRAMGVGVELLEGLTKRAKGVKVFSIISEDNLATQKIAIRNNTRKIVTYFSDKLEKVMGVWMPETMIEDDWDLKP